MKVSVAITAYEHAPFVAQALDSVLAQRGPFELEVVVGEDASRDGTREIVAGYAARHPGTVRAVLPEANLGAGGRRLFAEVVRACRGRYIAALDGDDYWASPEKLRRQVELLEGHPECPACFHEALRLAPDGSFSPTRGNRPGFFGLDDVLLQRCTIPACSPVFRREALQPLPDWYSNLDLPFGDWPLYILAAERGPLGYVPEALGVYRVHTGGMWSRMDQVERLRQTANFCRTIDSALGYRHSPLLRRNVARCEVEIAALQLGRGERRQARASLAAALRSRSFPGAAPLAHLGRAAIAGLLPGRRRRREAAARPEAAGGGAHGG